MTELLYICAYVEWLVLCTLELIHHLVGINGLVKRLSCLTPLMCGGYTEDNPNVVIQ